MRNASKGGDRADEADGAAVEVGRAEDENLTVSVVDTIRAVKPSAWNEVVDRSPRGTLFHRYEWLEAVEAGLDHEPRHLVVKKSGNPIGVFPNFLVDLAGTPFRQLSSLRPGFGGPLLPTDTRRSLSLVTDAIPDLCTGRTIAHEIQTTETSALRYSHFFQSRGYEASLRNCRFQLELDGGYDETLAGMSANRRRGIRRARERVRVVEEEPTEADLRRFYGAYERVMDRHGSDPHPFSFFEALLDLRSRILFHSARVDGEYAGAFFDLVDDDRATIHGFIGAVPRDYFDHHVTEGLVDAEIRWGIENGYDRVDFGGSPADFRDGVFRFKEAFGGTLVPTLQWERGCSVLWKPFAAARSMRWRRSG